MADDQLRPVWLGWVIGPPIGMGIVSARAAEQAAARAGAGGLAASLISIVAAAIVAGATAAVAVWLIRRRG